MNFLKDLLQSIIDVSVDLPIEGISSNSQEVKNNYIFVALSDNAKNYIHDAIVNGAVVVILSPFNNSIDEKVYDVLFLYHPNPKNIYNKIASRFYPNQPDNICAVTGTNGKTSTVNFVQQLLSFSGRNSISIGTIGVKSNISILNEHTNLTTPDSIDLHRVLNNAKINNVNYAAIEASSHGIEQMRMHSINIKAAGFTNISIDHLDYHNTLEQYLKTKIKLFNEILPEDGYAIINSDIDEYFEIISSIRTKNIVTYGINSKHLQLISQTPRNDGQDLCLNILGKNYKIYLPLLGTFQAYNLLCAIGLLLYSDDKIKFEDLYFDKISQISGRMELIQNDCDIKIILDYSHTPDSLEKLLLSLRWHFKEKINIVFGCGGNRDKSKRPLMGNIASKLANIAIICDDNPRMEDASTIRKEILSGFNNDNGIEIPNRSDAIKFGIDNTKKNEILVVAGKGHENYQIIGNTKIPYSDLEVINNILNN